MNKLYFLSSNNEKCLVKENLRDWEVVGAIREYVTRLNPNFHIYYIRTWQAPEGATMYDVGSHTEFFILEEYKNDNT